MDEQSLQNGVQNELIYDRKTNGYRLSRTSSMKFTNEETLAICKILLDSRAFRKDDMDQMLDKLLDCCAPTDDRKTVRELISNARFHYIPPHHNSHFMDKLWQLGQAIHHNQKVTFFYKGIKGTHGHERIVDPLAIMFSEYYFYLVGIVESVNHKTNFEKALVKIRFDKQCKNL